VTADVGPWTAALFEARELNTFYGTAYTVEQLEQVADIDLQDALEAARGIRRDG
jgi:hypothetical protein